MRRVVAITLVLSAPACASTPKGTVTMRSTTPTVVAPRAEAAQAPGATPLGSHEIFWAKTGGLVAANEETSCGPPSEDNECRSKAWLRAIDPTAPTKEIKRADSHVFGFRADGEWLVIRAKGGAGLEEWAPRTDKMRPSEFAARAKDAMRVCLSPDDDHLLVLLGEKGPTVLRSRLDPKLESALETRSFAPVPPNDCAFAPVGEAFALADANHVAVYRIGQAAPEAWLPLPNVRHLTWSADGAALAFSVRDAEADETLVFQWHPKQGRVVSHATGGEAVFHPRLPELLVRTQCEWHRRGTKDGKQLGRIGAAAEACVHVREQDVLLAPTGTFIAALEGEYGGRTLIVLPVAGGGRAEKGDGPAPRDTPKKPRK